MRIKAQVKLDTLLALIFCASISAAGIVTKNMWMYLGGLFIMPVMQYIKKLVVEAYPEQTKQVKLQ